MEQFSNFTFVKQISLEVLGSKFMEEMELPQDFNFPLFKKDLKALLVSPLRLAAKGHGQRRQGSGSGLILSGGERRLEISRPFTGKLRFP